MTRGFQILQMTIWWKDSVGIRCRFLNDNQILSLKKYVQDNQLNIDVKSLEEGNGVLVIHDHMLTGTAKTCR